jgi:hypothetical protein
MHLKKTLPLFFQDLRSTTSSPHSGHGMRGIPLGPSGYRKRAAVGMNDELESSPIPCGGPSCGRRRGGSRSLELCRWAASKGWNDGLERVRAGHVLTALDGWGTAACRRARPLCRRACAEDQGRQPGVGGRRRRRRRRRSL